MHSAIVGSKNTREVFLDMYSADYNGSHSAHEMLPFQSRELVSVDRAEKLRDDDKSF